MMFLFFCCRFCVISSPIVVAFCCCFFNVVVVFLEKMPQTLFCCFFCAFEKDVPNVVLLLLFPQIKGNRGARRPRRQGEPKATRAPLKGPPGAGTQRKTAQRRKSCHEGVANEVENKSCEVLFFVRDGVIRVLRVISCHQIEPPTTNREDDFGIGLEGTI